VVELMKWKYKEADKQIMMEVELMNWEYKEADKQIMRGGWS
jgi:hypothetical protein